MSEPITDRLNRYCVDHNGYSGFTVDCPTCSAPPTTPTGGVAKVVQSGKVNNAKMFALVAVSQACDEAAQAGKGMWHIGPVHRALDAIIAAVRAEQEPKP